MIYKNRSCKICSTIFTPFSSREAWCSNDCRFKNHIPSNLSENNCWNWLGAKYSTGYGQFGSVKYGNGLAHRYSYQLFVGVIPESAIVIHKCSNKLCFNPLHLMLSNDEQYVKQLETRKTISRHKAAKTYYAKHYSDLIKRNQNYRANNPEKIAVWKQKDRTINSARISADNAKRRSKINSKLTPAIHQMYALRDFYIAMSLGDNFHVDHIIPLAKGGLHCHTNLRVIPAIDNLRKGVN